MSPQPAATRPRVLHLAYEDPEQPGAGGGSVRTAEINERLAGEFDLEVVTAPFPGARSRRHGDVRYRHAGLPGAVPSRTARIMSYFAALPAVVALRRPDLVVEDFGAPISSYGLPMFTRRPVVGVVQWLFAGQKSAQYHLPLRRVESFGLRRHHDLIAVSADLAAEIRRRSPAARVTVVPNGLPEAAFTAAERALPAGDLRYLGRLEDAQKGVDLLLQAYAKICSRIPQDLLIGGTGPDEQALLGRARDLGVGHRVHFVGAVPAVARFDWLAAADVVAMPSRYETFGMVAAEALATARPVVAFDIPCLRDLVSQETGRLVRPFDVDHYADALFSVAADPALRERLGSTGRQRVRHLTWDAAAATQAEVYHQVLESSRR